VEACVNAVGAEVIAAFQLVLSLLLAPLVPGIINRVKAVVAGRRGQPLLQAYYDIAKLLSKGSVYSSTTSWVFKAGPSLGCAAALVALSVLPWGAGNGLLSFEGDLIVFAGLFGLMRFLTILAALDTGSAFEGMGASREAWFSALAEPALLLGLASLAGKAHSISLAGVLAGPGIGGGRGAAVLLAAGAIFIVFLSENARIPVDDPTTHLELTMIHEVMVLDHSGVDLAYIQYGSSVKLWALGGLLVGILRPRTGAWQADLAIGLGGMACVGITTGLVESFIARLRLSRVPQLLVAAVAMSALALALSLVR
jgi:formate hydrogenlyase subunit 4